ncbi:hypothetical protein BGZ67_003424 [Mortierella alpina]|nr:hypothetical protein BGZ67_003424 [Mortierella alpina]
MVQALCLPEILATVGLFLDLDDLASCLCVCKTWHATFLPLRWRDVRIAGIHSVCADVQIRRHAHLVRSLAFLHIVSLKHFQSVDRYDRLERIHITKTDIDGRKVWDKIAALVRQNRPTLRTMILEDMMPPPEFLMTLTEQEYEESGRGRTINSAGSSARINPVVHGPFTDTSVRNISIITIDERLIFGGPFRVIHDDGTVL